MGPQQLPNLFWYKPPTLGHTEHAHGTSPDNVLTPSSPDCRFGTAATHHKPEVQNTLFAFVSDCIPQSNTLGADPFVAMLWRRTQGTNYVGFICHGDNKADVQQHVRTLMESYLQRRENEACMRKFNMPRITDHIIYIPLSALTQPNFNINTLDSRLTGIERKLLQTSDRAIVEAALVQGFEIEAGCDAELPQNIIERILGSLAIRDSATIPLVCRKFNTIFRKIHVEPNFLLVFRIVLDRMASTVSPEILVGVRQRLERVSILICDLINKVSPIQPCDRSLRLQRYSTKIQGILDSLPNCGLYTTRMMCELLFTSPIWINIAKISYSILMPQDIGSYFLRFSEQAAQCATLSWRVERTDTNTGVNHSRITCDDQMQRCYIPALTAHVPPQESLSVFLTKLAASCPYGLRNVLCLQHVQLSSLLSNAPDRHDLLLDNAARAIAHVLKLLTSPNGVQVLELNTSLVRLDAILQNLYNTLRCSMSQPSVEITFFKEIDDENHMDCTL
jgi:hypothetical protein